jgi:hypothetical protein
MKDEGKYLHLWMKYVAVIRLLLKKTDTENQRLRLYKYEIENLGHKAMAGYVFSFELNNGKLSKLVSTTAIAKDLVEILNNDIPTRKWLKEHSIKISLDKSFELLIEKNEVV